MPPRLTIKSAAFISESSFLAATDSSQLIKTTDNGTTWNYFNAPGNSYINFMHFFTPQHGIAAGTGGYFYQTNDGGNSWTDSIISMSSTNFTYGRILNDSTWVLLGQNSNRIQKTTNFGRTWTTATFPFVLSADEKVAFLDINNVLLVNGSNMYRSTNGGSQWSILSFANNVTPAGVHFFSPEKAILYTTQGAIYTSSDIGQSWFFSSTIPNNITHTLFLSQNRCAFITGSRYLYTSSDAGATFDSLLLPQSGGIPSLLFGQSLNKIGFATHLGHLYISYNAGFNWKDHIAALPLKLNAVDCSYSNSLFTAVGDRGRIFSIQQLTSIPELSPTQFNLKAIARGGNTRGIIVGDSGTILYRPLGANKWFLSANTYNVNLRGAAYDHAEVAGYAVGEKGVVLFSSNAGQDWILKRQGIYPQHLNSVIMKGKQTAYAVGDSGIFLTTTDEGQTWNLVPLGTSNNLYGISSNGENFLIVGTQGTGFRSTDNGNTWFSSPFSPSHDIISVQHFSTPSAAAVTKTGISLLTSNNGQSWSIDAEFSQREITALSYFNAYTGAMTTRDGFVLYRNAILPVELISFFVSENNGEVVLNWSTASEINNFGFEVQKSNDHHIWQTIGFVHGKGTTTERSLYAFTDKHSEPGLIYYRLIQKDFDGTTVITAEKEFYITEGFGISQNYPNPFNPLTRIDYILPIETYIEIKIYNSLGSEIKTLVNGIKSMGAHHVLLDARDFPSGIYYYTLKSGTRTFTKKMAVLK